jgi:hypothetical protein
VNLVNWQGSAIFGPGSEWFWAMAQFVVVVVTLLGIYRQLQAQASANAIGRLESLTKRWESRLLSLARVRAAMSLRYAEPQTGLTHEMFRILDFFADLGNLYREGHIGIREVDDNWGGSIQVWTGLMRDRIKEQRAIDGDPGLHADLEGLASQLSARRVARGGEAMQIDADSSAGWLDLAITRNIAALELMRDTESSDIPSAPALTPTDANP